VHRKPTLADLETHLGYRFRDRSYLNEALTHSSAKKRETDPDLERLEFLGDRVLGLWAAAVVSRHDMQDALGDRARSYNRLVCAETCAAVANTIELGLHIKMAASEARSGGRRKTVILADACEAVLGAVFLDGGYDAAASVLTRLWTPFVGEALQAAKDPKTALQEFAQKRKLGLPVYVELERSGADHAPSFVVQVHVSGHAPATGTGASLKKAQQAAAEALMMSLSALEPASG
jgi:ribonuclease-3